MRTKTVFLHGAIAVFAVSTLVAAQMPDIRWFDGEKAEADTFWISTAEELAGLAMLVNNSHNGGSDFRGKTVVLVKNIDLKDWGEWVPIGTVGTVGHEDGTYDVGVARPFSGVFDGNGKAVAGLVVSEPPDYKGLFGVVKYGEVKNLDVVDAHVSVGYNCGAVVGRLVNGTVSNSYSSGIVTGTDCVGGISGRVTNGTVTSCYSTAKVGAYLSVGGIVGRIDEDGKVTNCYSTGAVGNDPKYKDHPRYGGYVTEPQVVGGVVGWVIDGEVTNCYSTGEIRGYSEIGGIVGKLENGIVKNCVALNPIVNAYYREAGYGGRVIGQDGSTSYGGIGEGDYTHTDNLAFKSIKGVFPAATGTSTINGADITIEKILTDSTLNENLHN